MANVLGGKSSSWAGRFGLSGVSSMSTDTCKPASLLAGGRAGIGTFDMNRAMARSILEKSRTFFEDAAGAYI